MNKFSEINRKKIVQVAKKSLRDVVGQKALKYLKDERCLTDSVIEKFDFGYCPFNINHQLKGRIITPIYDAYGELVALSTKSLYIKKGDKFHFWHESFDKSFYLYGLYYARDSIIKHQKAILVEGEFDVIALHSNGFNMTVGMCGSAFTLYQSSLLSRYCSDIYLVFDGDEGGDTAYKQAYKMYEDYNLKSFGLNYISVMMPKGQDPDKYIRGNGRKKFKELLANAKEEYYLMT